MVLRDLDLEGCVQTQFDCLYCCFGEDIWCVDLLVFLPFSVTFRGFFFFCSDKVEALFLCKREGEWQIKFLKMHLLRNRFLQSKKDHQLGGSKHILAEILSP